MGSSQVPLHRFTIAMKALSTICCAALAVLAGCGTTTQPTLSTEASVDFNITATRQGEDAATILPLGADANAGPGSIIVMGHFRTPTPCYDLTAKAERSGRDITVTLTARRNDAAVCAQVIVVRSYSVRIAPLAAGSYTVKVIYETVHGRTDRETKLEKTVVVQ